MTIRAVFFVNLLLLALLTACSKSEVEEFDLEAGYEYFPTEIGKFIEYQVDSIVYDPVEAVDSSRTFVREVVVDTLEDNLGMPLYRIERFERKQDTLPWEIKRVYTIARSETQAFRTEENLRLIKMVFPVQTGRDWQSTVFIQNDVVVTVRGESIEMFKSWESEILTEGEPETINGRDFQEVATISHADSDNLLEKRFVLEKYAKDVGLVYLELWILDTQKIESTEPWEIKAEKGFIVRQTITNFN